MGYDTAALQRFILKIFVEPASAGEPSTIIPVFHRWIQESAVPGLLIDVADYTHLVDGPSVLLVAHEANYALDGIGGRPGLSYTRKQPSEGTLPERLATAAGRADHCRATPGGRYLPHDRRRASRSWATRLSSWPTTASPRHGPPMPRPRCGRSLPRSATGYSAEWRSTSGPGRSGPPRLHPQDDRDRYAGHPTVQDRVGLKPAGGRPRGKRCCPASPSRTSRATGRQPSSSHR